jgi:hypothetical protein
MMSYSNFKITDLRDVNNGPQQNFRLKQSDWDSVTSEPKFIRPPLIEKDAISKISEVFLRIIDSRCSFGQ